MKKTTILKSLIVAAGMLVGTSAWADLVPTTTTCNFENSETLFAFSGRGSVANASDPVNENNHVMTLVSASNAGNAAPGAFAYYDFSSQSQTAAKVEVSFDCYLPETAGQIKVSIGDATQRTSSIFTNKGAWSYNGNGAIFVFGTERGKLNGSTNENYASVNGVAIGSTTTLKANEILGLWVTVNATVDITNKKVSYEVKNKATSAVLVSTTDADFFNANASVCTQIDIQTGVNSVTAYIDNVSVTSYIDESEKYADYTIKYVYGTTEIKAARTVESVKVGNTTSILDSDKAAIWYGDPAEKYIYESDDAASQTVAEDGSTVVTVSFRKATTVAYTVNLINSADNSVLVENAFSGNVVEGESATVYYHKAVKVGNVWYVRAQNSGEPYYGVNVVAGTNTVSYTENNDVKYFFEVEDLPVVQEGPLDGWRNDGMASRSSNGQAPRHYKNNYAYTEALDGGVYTINMNARNQSSSVSDNIILAWMDEAGNITTFANQFEEWTKALTAEKTVSVSIPDGAKFVLKCGGNNSNLNMDFIMFTRTGDYVENKSISAAGYATYCSENALDFTNVEGLTAYVATVSGSEVSFTEVKKVPAETGVLLKGAAGEYQIPVIADGGEATSALVGVLEATKVPAGSYVLMNGEQGVGFYKTASEFTVGANTAYLPATSTARSFIGFDGESSTGISAVESSVLSTEVYDLQGRRVAQPTKGLYIMNGKKTVVR